VQTNSKPSVVLVDDEDMVITSLRAFLRLETDYHIHGFTDPEQAAQFLEKEQVDVIVTDYLMPKMNGIQLLGRAKDAQPEATRVLLTGHADKQSAIQAINEVSLFQYVEKPWDNAALLLVVNSAIERARLIRGLREKVGELDAAHNSLKDVQTRLWGVFL
jgi:DNA-binding NtrC family response regulator